MLFKKATLAGRDGLPTRYREYQVGWLRPHELPQIAHLEALLFPQPLRLGELVRLYLTPHTYYVAARKGRQVVAYIGFQLFGPCAHTISMGVHPAHRRRGLATLVQKTADRVASNRGARWFMGEVRRSNTAQLCFLERLGWRQMGVCLRFFPDGEDGVVVWNWL